MGIWEGEGAMRTRKFDRDVRRIRGGREEELECTTYIYKVVK